MKEQILELRAQGLSYNEIVKELGCSKSSVSYHCGKGQKRKQQIRNLRNYSKKNKYVRVRRKYLKAFSNRYKSVIGCKDCGNKDFRVLDYDHIDRETKFETVSRLVHVSYSLEVIKEEIRKCDVRCANCHRIKTIENKEYNNMKTVKKYKQ